MFQKSTVDDMTLIILRCCTKRQFEFWTFRKQFTIVFYVSTAKSYKRTKTVQIAHCGTLKLERTRCNAFVVLLLCMMAANFSWHYLLLRSLGRLSS